MTSSRPADESHALRGPTDRGALLDFLRTFERMEPFASGSLDDFLDPSDLQIELSDGIGPAERSRFDVVWTTRDDYSIHYTDNASQNCRWDNHPHNYPDAHGDAHFHPPPEASSNSSAVEDSCIEVTEIELVARAIHKLWRQAYERGTLDGINDASNSP